MITADQDRGAARSDAAPAARPPRAGRAPTCRHCGSPISDPRAEASGFCCAGCSYVYRLVHEQGLDGYYQIKDAITAPADATVFQPRDYGWLEAAQRQAEAAAAGAETTPAHVPELVLAIQGISCAGCVWLIERVFQQQPGARAIETNAQLGIARLRWVPGTFSATDFARRLQSLGYLLGPDGDLAGRSEARPLLRRIGLCAAFAMNVMLFALPAYFGLDPSDRYADLFGLLTLVFGTLSFLVGGTYFIGRAARALRERALHIDLPIAIGILGAYVGSLYGWLTGQPRFVYLDFVASFTLLMLVGRWAQVAAVERNQRRLLRQQARPARVERVGGGSAAPEELRTEDRFLVGSGQTVPVDSRLDTPEALFSLASINGEAEPRLFRAGQRVTAGAVNLGQAPVTVAALQPWSESLLAQLLASAPLTGARHVFLERIIRGYLVGVMLIAATAGIGWWLGTHDVVRTWSVVTAVLVVSCPCAIGLAFPLADEIAIVALRRRGVFVRTDDLWAKLGRIRQLVFDKTGTLTLETPVLRNPEELAALSPDARHALHLLVRDNPHPLSQCLLENLLAGGAPEPAEGSAPARVCETIGAGVEVDCDGHRWSLGRPGWRTAAAAPHPATVDATGDMVLACDGVALARFHFADTARPDAAREIAALHAAGFSTHILSGDRSGKVAMLARDLGIPDARALGEVSPQAKAAWIQRHDARDTLMLGDGANDSLAFDAAFCRGTPVIHRGMLEQKADFYYLGRGIGGLRALFEVNRVRRHAQIAILVFSVAYNVAAVAAAAAGHMNPLIAAILMPANSLLTLALVVGWMRRAFRT